MMDTLIQNFFDGTCSASEKDYVVEHLEKDPKFREAYQLYLQLHEDLQKSVIQKPRASLTGEIMSQLPEAPDNYKIHPGHYFGIFVILALIGGISLSSSYSPVIDPIIDDLILKMEKLPSNWVFIFGVVSCSMILLNFFDMVLKSFKSVPWLKYRALI